jgi:hypothetical protein
MTMTLLSLIEGTLLIAGAVGAFLFSRLAKRSLDRKAVLMASVASWLILFGMIPFFAFAILVYRVDSGAPPTAWQEFVLNTLPFALVVSPLAGFIHGVKLSSLGTPK